LVRWRLKLEEYDYEIVHKADKGNTNDALSRNPIPDDQHNVSQGNEEEEGKEEEAPKKYMEDEKREYHDMLTERHQGIARTLSRIQLKHNWRGIT